MMLRTIFVFAVALAPVLAGDVPGQGNLTTQSLSARPVAASSAVAGKWKLVSKTTEGRERRVTLDLWERNGTLGGALLTEEGDTVGIADVKLDGATVRFRIPVDEGSYTVELTMTGDDCTGSYKAPGGATGTVSGKRA